MSRRILMVDDSEHDQISHKRALRNTDWAIMTATTLAAGLAIVREHTPDVILLDYNLPDGTGLDFIQRLHDSEETALPSVVMLTGSGDERVAVEAMKAGANDYLIKDLAGGHLQLLPAVIERAFRERTILLAKQEADRQLQLAANVYQNITEGILITEPNGTIVSVNPGLCQMNGYTAEEQVGQNPRIMKSNQHPPEFYQGMWKNIAEKGSWQGEIWNRRKSGGTFISRETITAIRDPQGRLVNYVAVLVDITEAKLVEEMMRHQAHHDPLTGLPNRSLFMDRLRHGLAYAHRQRSIFAVLFIDLDGFKAINDELGHKVGDDLLQQAATRLAGCIRESDTLARLGGDEFTAILSNLDSLDDSARVAEKMLTKMAQPFLLGRQTRTLSASIGIALYPYDGDDAELLLKAADEAMYQVKKHGKAAYSVASPHAQRTRTDERVDR